MGRRGIYEMGANGLSARTPLVMYTEIPGAKLERRGKVRDMYDAGTPLQLHSRRESESADPIAAPGVERRGSSLERSGRGDAGGHVLMVASDRISAFDVVLPTGIPDKGFVLTQISRFWFDQSRELIANHLVSTEVKDFPPVFQAQSSALAGRSMLVRRAAPLPVECVVRGYLSGSGWNEYAKRGTVCGIPLPKGLTESQKLEGPIFTPSTKAEKGHDINISFDEAVKILGDRKLAERLRDISIQIYTHACQTAEKGGVIIADTKFEFGLIDGQVILIDEVITPDSSRFWPKSEYEPGRSQRSFDKQFVRDYLLSLKWDKTPPGPPLPQEIVTKTREKYLEAYRLLTGQAL